VALYLVLNAYWEPLDFELPPPVGEPASGQDHGWRAVLDTSLPSPRDLVTYREALPINGETYRVGPRSVVLLARPVATPRPAGSGTTQQPAVQRRSSPGGADRTRRTIA
jgi:glycogen operon protein